MVHRLPRIMQTSLPLWVAVARQLEMLSELCRPLRERASYGLKTDDSPCSLHRHALARPARFYFFETSINHFCDLWGLLEQLPAESLEFWEPCNTPPSFRNLYSVIRQYTLKVNTIGRKCMTAIRLTKNGWIWCTFLQCCLNCGL